MNIPNKYTQTFDATINTFFTSYLPIYIHKVFNFALYQQEVNNEFLFVLAFIDNEDNKP